MNIIWEVILLFVLYGMFILLPIIPSSFIHSRFPKERIGAKGILGNLTINASGAFAAYIITAVLGYFIVNQTTDSLRSCIDHKLREKSVWTVEADLVFLDSLGNELPMSPITSTNKLRVRTNPPFYVNTAHTAVANLHRYSPETLISYELDGFTTITRLLANERGQEFNVDSTQQTIKLGEIKLVQNKIVDNSKLFASSDSGKVLKPLNEIDSVIPPNQFYETGGTQ